MDTVVEVNSRRQIYRRFARWLTVLLIVSFWVASSTVGAARSGTPFLAALTNNVVASVAWTLPWIVIIGVVGFVSSWALLQIGRPRMISWWRGGLVALASAALVSLAHLGLNSWIDSVASVGYTGNGRTLETTARAWQALMFIALSTISGMCLAVLVSLSRRLADRETS